MKQLLQEASVAAAKLEELKLDLGKLELNIKEQHELRHIACSSNIVTSVAEANMQLKALTTLSVRFSFHLFQ